MVIDMSLSSLIAICTTIIVVMFFNTYKGGKK